MTRDRAGRHLSTLPLRRNGAEFQGWPAGTLLVARVVARQGRCGDCTLHITLCRPPAGAGDTPPHPTAFFPVPAADVVYTFPDDAVPASRAYRGAVLGFPEPVTMAT